MDGKKSKKGLLMLLLLLVVIVAIAGGAYYYLKNMSPKNVFVNKISATLDEANLENSKEVKNIRKINGTVTLSGNIETTNEEVKEIAKIINDGKIKLNVQSDLDTKKTLVGVDLDYQNEKLIQAKGLYQLGDNNVYLFIQDLYDKYFKINLSEASESIDLSTLYNTSANVGELKVKDASKERQIFKNIITDNLKDEYFSKETADDMTKNTMKFTMNEFFNIYTNIYTALKDNQEYLNCYENPEKVKDYFDNTLKAIPDIKKAYSEYLDDINFELSLYTKGFSSEVKKIEVKATDSESEEGKFVINKSDENTYEYLLEIKTKENGMPITAEALKGTFKIEKIDDETRKATLVVDNIPDVGKVTLNMELNFSTNTDIENIDVSNSVDIENMSQDELYKLYTNLTNMKIYPYVSQYFE